MGGVAWVSFRAALLSAVVRLDHQAEEAVWLHLPGQTGCPPVLWGGHKHPDCSALSKGCPAVFPQIPLSETIFSF